MKTVEEHIKDTLRVIPGNFEYIAKTGAINGTLLADLRRMIDNVKAEAIEAERERCGKIVFNRMAVEMEKQVRCRNVSAKARFHHSSNVLNLVFDQIKTPDND